MEERIARIEGILEHLAQEMRERFGSIEQRIARLEASKADKWEIRIWFIILILIMMLLRFL